MVSSDGSSTAPGDVEAKKTLEHQVETVHTNERVPGHPNYIEKKGLRTYGDDVDHDQAPRVSPMSKDPVEGGEKEGAQC